MQCTMLRVRQTPVSLHRHMARRVHRQVSTQAASASVDVASTSASAAGWKRGCEIRMLYDGECALCLKEVNFLRRRDAGAGRIDFVDIAAPSYRPEDNAGITFEQAMERIHAILPDGTILRDVEVFRRLYEAVGLGWVYAVTKNKAVEAAANSVYGVWAKYRTQVTGREALDVILARHRAQGAGSLCRTPDGQEAQEGAACEVPAAGGSGREGSTPPASRQ